MAGPRSRATVPAMDEQQFFVEQHGLVETVVGDMVLGALSDQQLRCRPRPDQNSVAWLLWHAARWEDVIISTWVAGRPQLFDLDGWSGRLGVATRHVGTAMTVAEAADLEGRIDLGALRAYAGAVWARTPELVAWLPPSRLDEVVDAETLGRARRDGASANARAPWLDSFFANRSRRFLISFLNLHNAEHMIGEALAVRGQGGFPLGL